MLDMNLFALRNRGGLPDDAPGCMNMATSQGAALYAERMKRIMDAVELREPDRGPTALFNMFWLARYGGISYREAMYQSARLSPPAEHATAELHPDMYAQPHLLTAV